MNAVGAVFPNVEAGGGNPCGKAGEVLPDGAPPTALPPLGGTSDVSSPSTAFSILLTSTWFEAISFRIVHCSAMTALWLLSSSRMLPETSIILKAALLVFWL